MCGADSLSAVNDHQSEFGTGTNVSRQGEHDDYG
jgi:hypothetical protein